MFSLRLILFVLTSIAGVAQEFKSTSLTIPSEKIPVNGTLLKPADDSKVPLVILIPGSGAVDRDGNVGALKMNSLKDLAYGLAEHKIASYRYDKSAIAAVQIEGFKETDMSFDDFIVDAKNVLQYFKKSEEFSEVIFIGHSQGSLVAMLAAQDGADALISIAGPGRSIDKIITDQVMAQSALFEADLNKTFGLIAEGKVDQDFNPLLASIFRTSLQPFWGSWMKYVPTKELKKLEIPVLIINGTNDIQVPVTEAELLHAAMPTSNLVLIPNMNHAFKAVTSTDRAVNIAAYSDENLKLMPQLIKTIVEFIEK